MELIVQTAIQPLVTLNNHLIKTNLQTNTFLIINRPFIEQYRFIITIVSYNIELKTIFNNNSHFHDSRNKKEELCARKSFR